VSAATPDQVRQARERLDAQVREIVEWHFHPETGTPFWLEKAKSYKFDPRKDVKGFDDLKRFGEFEDEWLRGGPVRRWVPKALAKKPIYVGPLKDNKGNLVIEKTLELYDGSLWGTNYLIEGVVGSVT